MQLKSRRNFLATILYATFGAFTTKFSGNKMRYKTRNDHNFEPGYLELHKSGELKRRGEKLWEMMESCELCPRMCGANRLEGEEGFCHASSQLEISSFNPHFGEEKPLVGSGGSGTIFLTNCGLKRIE